MKRFIFDCGSRETLTSIALLALRVSTGAMMFFGHGLGKLRGYEKMIATLAAEVLAPVLLILGLATRPAAFLLSFAMVIAAFEVHAADPFATKEKAFLYLAMGITLILSGAGSFSLDALLYREKRRRW
ncbi:MAG: DoxX family protein [Verrucomicrobiota bacterium]